MRPPVRYIDTRKLASEALDELHAQGAVPMAVDTEFDPKTDAIRLLSYSWGAGVRRVVDGSLVKEFFAKWLSSPKSRLVYQNFKADKDQFAAMGIDVVPSFYADVMIMGVLVDETLVRHDLKNQARVFLHWRRSSYKDLFSYVPEDRKLPVTMNPFIVMDDPPPDALKVRSHADWRQLMLEYSGDDAESTLLLFLHHRDVLKSVGYWDQYLAIDKPYTLTLDRCSTRGVRVNIPRLQQISRAVAVAIMRTQYAFRCAAGKPDLNLNSLPQMRKLLIDEWGWPTRDDFRTEAGEPSLHREAMEWWLDEGYALAGVKIDYNNAIKLKSAFLDSLISGVSEDGRMRSDFNQIGGKRTGRISSRKRNEEIEIEYTLKSGVTKTRTKKIKVGANLQNIPSRKEKDPYGIRAAFVAPRKGDITARGTIAKVPHRLIVCDYSGFELCMAVHYAAKYTPSSKMLKTMLAYGSPSSLHAFTAINLYADAKHVCTTACTHKGTQPPGTRTVLGRIPMADWKLVKAMFPDEYAIAKNNNFNLLYGGSAQMMARLRGLDVRDPRALEECQEQADAWNSLNPEIGVYQRQMVKHGYKHGWVPTISGRRIHVAQYLNLDPSDRENRGKINHGERCCMNGPCQGSAADIVKVAMNLIEWDEELDSYGASLLFPVHDEIILECPEDMADAVLARTIHLMKQPFKSDLAFELDVEGKAAYDWQTAKG